MIFKLRWIDYLVLLVLFLAGYGFTVTQKFYIPEPVRPAAVILILMAFGPFLAVELCGWLRLKSQ